MTSVPPSPPHSTRADILIVGAGLAGLVAAGEAAAAGRSVILLDQEGPQSLGGQAFWSFGGLFLVDSPEQRRMGVNDSPELAWRDWEGTAGFDRPEDRWPRQWARAYVEWAGGPKREWVRSFGVGFFPVVGWAERGGHGARGPGNTVPRFHIVWGTGPALVEAFAHRLSQGPTAARTDVRFRHRVTRLLTEGGRVVGVEGEVLEDQPELPRGAPSSRQPVDTFTLRADAVVLTSGGMGGNEAMVRKHWPERMGPPPEQLLFGVPDHVDGLMLDAAEAAGAHLINRDRMWHYTEGIRNFDPIWSRHGIRILPGPSSLWLDARGRRLPAPYFPGFDTLGTLEHLRTTGFDHSWFILTQRIIEKEFALSGSEQNPDLTGKSLRLLMKRLGPGAPGPVEDFKERGKDFLVRRTLPELVEAMNGLVGEARLDPSRVEEEVRARDGELANPFGKDAQWNAIHRAREYRGDRLLRVARPHRLLDPAAGPLIAVRLNLLTRKSLGGLHTDLEGRVLKPDGEVFPGLYAAGEAAGFGGGGMHGYRSLEGSFLGGCLFSGKRVGEALGAE
ncbi:MAG: FAD-binding dehydrogenase [Gemmatimonadota bacterium]